MAYKFPKSLAELNRMFPSFSFAKNRCAKALKQKPICIEDREDKSVVFCDGVLVIALSRSKLDRDVPVVATNGKVCVIAFLEYEIKESLRTYLVQNDIKRDIISN